MGAPGIATALAVPSVAGMVNVRRLAIGATVVAASAALGYGTGKLLVRRSRHRPDPLAGEDFDTLADLDVHSLQVTTHDGGTLHVLTKGEGRPVVLLHGITLRGSAWRYQFALADRARVLAVDHRGHGRSVAGSDGYGLNPLADDLADLLVALDLRDAVLVGHSMGGMTIMRFARRHPDLLRERVAGLVLVATTAEPVLGLGVAHRHRRVGALLERRGPLFRLGERDFDYGLVRLTFGDRALPHHVEALRRMAATMDPEALHRSAMGLMDNDELGALGEVKVPVTVMVGSRDALTPPRHSRRMAAAFPDAELVVLEGAGHELMLERPDEVNAAIAAMLERTTPA